MHVIFIEFGLNDGDFFLGLCLFLGRLGRVFGLWWEFVDSDFENKFINVLICDGKFMFFLNLRTAPSQKQCNFVQVQLTI